MRIFLSGLFFNIVTSTILGATDELEAAAESASSVPESSVAILVGGLLWFMLLRKRA